MLGLVLWACLLAGGWGLVFALLLCSLGVFACLLVCACLGWWDSVVPPPLHACLLACLRAHALVWAVLACAMLPWVRGNGNGAGHVCPAPTLLVAVPPLRGVEGREGLGVRARSGEYTHTEGGRRAGWCWRAHSLGAYNSLVAWAGAVVIWCERPSGEYNPLVA